MMIGRRSVVVALAFLDRERSIGADGWRRDLLIERIREHNEIEAVRGNRFRSAPKPTVPALSEFETNEILSPAPEKDETSNPETAKADALIENEYDNRIAEGIQRALRALERGDLDDAERHCEQAERYVVREWAFRLQQLLCAQKFFRSEPQLPTDGKFFRSRLASQLRSAPKFCRAVSQPHCTMRFIEAAP